MAQTPIPRHTGEPDAVPAEWNTRYDVVDANFANVDGRLSANEGEVHTARSGENNLNTRLGKIDANIAGLDPDMQNMVVASISEALSLGGMANRELTKTLQQRFQTGTTTIYNRGVIKEATVTVGSGTRNLDLAAGSIFIHGRIIPVSQMNNSAVVPANADPLNPSFCYAYLYLDGNDVLQHDCTPLGQEVPENGLVIYKIDIPANNTEATDPSLANCTFTDQRRVESAFPAYIINPAFIYVENPFDMIDNAYAVDLDLIDFEGTGFGKGFAYVADRLSNGFKIYTNGITDKIQIRWTTRKLSL